jgi:hypothetical protein
MEQCRGAFRLGLVRNEPFGIDIDHSHRINTFCMSGWTRERVLTRVREVSVWEKGDQRAPHKPLLILYALGKLLEGQDEIRFKDFYEPFRDLLQEFGPPRKVYHLRR